MKDISIVIKPTLMTTSPGLRDYLPHKRQCYYSDEKRLEYFKFYSQNNCKLECFTNATLERCGCVAFYMPSKYPQVFGMTGINHNRKGVREIKNRA